jgi:predicted  nucleic acid-binding Zn-ribbon protein
VKAEVRHQRSLLEVADLDAELARIAHRIGNLPEQKHYQAIDDERRAATDRLAVLGVALEDIDGQISRLEAEIEGVRQREIRDQKLLDSGTVKSTQVSELNHELEALQRRRDSLEDSLLEVMELREQRAEEHSTETTKIDELQADLAKAQLAKDDALADIEQTREQRSARRAALVADLDAGLLDMYERQRAASGIGAGALQGARCGACRIELDRGELSRISAAPEDEVLRCPECRAILIRNARFG